MALALVTEWPPEALMPVLKLAMLFGLAQAQGLVLHFLCAGPTLVGEILAGVLLGPHILDLAPMRSELEVVGQLAMLVVLFERGLYTNFSSIAHCGGIGALMAILGITFSMTLVTVAMRVNGFPFIESVCTGCILSASVVGLVDIGWSRRQVIVINPCSSLTSKVIDAGTTINTMLILSVMTVLKNIDPESKWNHPVSQWWVVCQPMLFSLAFIIGGIFIRMLFNFFCLKDVIGSFFPPKNDPSSELYNAMEFAQVTFMTAFAMALGVSAEIVKVPAIVGIFVAGVCFGGSETCRESWDRNTRNLTHWLSRIFFTCSIGFILPQNMATKRAVLDGWEVGSAAFFGSFIAGAVGSLPVLLKEKRAMSNIVLCGSAMAYSGEVGFMFLLEFWTAGYLSEKGLASAFWGLLLSAVIAPALCQVCIFVQIDESNANGLNSSEVGAKYQLPDEFISGDGAGSPLNTTGASLKNSMDTKASQFRSTMQYATPGGAGDKEREVPLIYNGHKASSPFSYPSTNANANSNGSNGYAPYIPSPKEPSPTSAPMGPVGAGGRAAFYGGSASQLTPTIMPGLQPAGTLSMMPSQDRALAVSVGRGVPATLNGVYTSPSGTMPNNNGYNAANQNGSYTPNANGGYTPNGGYASSGYNTANPNGSYATPNVTGGYTPTGTGLGVMGTPSNPITAVPINSQMRRTVPSIWADDD